MQISACLVLINNNLIFILLLMILLGKETAIETAFLWVREGTTQYEIVSITCDDTPTVSQEAYYSNDVVFLVGILVKTDGRVAPFLFLLFEFRRLLISA